MQIFETQFQTVKNPDSAYVKELKKKIKTNNGFCPNQIEKNADTKCPCRSFRERQECYCGMYIKIPVYEEE